MKKIFLLFVIFGCVCGPLKAQENTESTNSTAQETTGTVPPTLRNPADLADPFIQGLGQNADPRMLTGMRNELTQNLREITQMLGNIDPQDTQFIESLKREQNFIIEQLKQIEAQTKAVANPATTNPAATNPAATNPAATTPASGAQTPQLPGNLPALPENWQQMSPDELARHFATQPQQPYRPAAASQLPPMQQPSPFAQPQANNEAQQMQEIVKKMRESGLNELADQTLANWQRETQTRNLPTTIPPMTNPQMPPFPNSPALPTVPGGYSPAAIPPGVLGATPWQPMSGQDVTELRETISKLNLQIEQLQKDVKAMETQLQLLNQNLLLKQQN